MWWAKPGLVEIFHKTSGTEPENQHLSSNQHVVQNIYTVDASVHQQHIPRFNRKLYLLAEL